MHQITLCSCVTRVTSWIFQCQMSQQSTSGVGEATGDGGEASFVSGTLQLKSSQNRIAFFFYNILCRKSAQDTHIACANTKCTQDKQK